MGSMENDGNKGDKDTKADNTDSITKWIVAISAALSALAAIGLNVPNMLGLAMFALFVVVGLWLLRQKEAGFWWKLFGLAMVLAGVMAIYQTISVFS